MHDVADEEAWVNVIIDRGLYDRDFIEQWIFEFDELKQCAAEYTPERVAEITWLPTEQIVAFAIAYAGNKRAASTPAWRDFQRSLL